MRNTLLLFVLISILTLTINDKAHADGVVVDKVYHPYVLPNEREFEWRLMSNQASFNGLDQRIGYGQSISEYVTVEAYLVGERDQDNDFGLTAYEIEARWMMTDQGKYWADWGMLFEVEKQHKLDNWEVTTALLMEKEFGKTSLTLNFFAIYEWGHTIENEWESEFRLNYRYRFSPQFQPAIELFAGEDFIGIGPAVIGIQRFDGQKQLKWEAGFITEVSQSGKNHTLRFSLEYEF
jgi:hypothetical protein